MLRSDCEQRIWELTYTARLNQWYYQRMSWRLRWYDRGIRIAVAVLAVASAFLAFPDAVHGWVSFGFSASSAMAAVVLNVLPVGDWYSSESSLYRRWSDLRSRCERTAFHIRNSEKEDVEEFIELELQELEFTKGQIDADETQPNETVLEDTRRKLNHSIDEDLRSMPSDTSASGGESLRSGETTVPAD